MGKVPSSWEHARSAAGNGSGSEALERIAELLGCSPAAFLKDGAPSFETDAAELLRIWCSIEDSEDRQRVLEFARTLVRR